MTCVNYPTGDYRAVLQFFYDFTLGGMVLPCSSLEVEAPGAVCGWAELTALGSTGLGAWLFRRAGLR